MAVLQSGWGVSPRAHGYWKPIFDACLGIEIPCGRGLAPDDGGSVNECVDWYTAIGGKPPPTGDWCWVLERVAWDAYKAFHQHPRATAHDGLLHHPFAVDLGGFSAARRQRCPAKPGRSRGGCSGRRWRSWLFSKVGGGSVLGLTVTGSRSSMPALE